MIPPPQDLIASPLSRAPDVFASALDSLICCSPGGLITSFNASAERLYGRAGAEVTGTPVDRLFAPGRAADERAALDRVLAGEHVAHYVSQHVGADGEAVDVSVALSPMRDEDGACVGASLFVRDVSERTAIERELAQTRALLEHRAAELARSNADLEQFAYIASHDLSEPLRTITGMLSLLQDECEGRLGEDADDYIGRAVAGADRLRTLIDDLLAYSRVGRR